MGIFFASIYTHTSDVTLLGFTFHTLEDLRIYHTLSTLSFTAHLVAKQIIVVISMAVAISNVTDAVLAERGGSESVPTVAVDLGRDATAKGE